MTRVRSWMGWVLAGVLWTAAGAGCQKPRVCPDGYKDRADGEDSIWCDRRGSQQKLYYQFYPGTRQKRQSCPFMGEVLEGDFQAWYPDGRSWLTGRYQHGKLAGKWLQWSETGSKVADGEYAEGRLIQGAPVALAAICDSIKP